MSSEAQARPPSPAPPRPAFAPRLLAAAALLLLMFLLPVIRRSRDASPAGYSFGGETMGTTYNVRVAHPPLPESAVRDLQDGVEAILAEVTRQMSTYTPDSEISAFNRFTNVTAFAVSRDLAAVVHRGLQISALSGGAFDMTVKPLVAAWGFDSTQTSARVPPPAELAKASALTGYRKLEAGLEPPTLRKAVPGLRVDLDAIAPGFAVDRIADYLLGRGCSNILVEVGGEVMTRGLNEQGRRWRVSVERPVLDAPVGGKPYRIVEVSDQAVATSGDYRHYVQVDGRRYQHILDPRTAWPVSNAVASVTVIAPDCTTADGLATALMVTGPEEGLKILATLTRVHALFVLRDEGGMLRDIPSPGFESYCESGSF